MGRGLRVIGSALHQLSTRFGASLLANVVAFLLSLPFVLLISSLAYLTRSFSLIPLGFTLFLGVLPSPTAAGVQNIAHEIVQGNMLELNDQWVGLRQHWRFALRTWLVGAAVTLLLLANLAFYAAQAANPRSSIAALSAPLSLLWLAALLLWLALHLYLYPLLMQQESPRVRTAYRNAFIMARERKLFTLTVVPIWLLLLLVTSATGLGTVIGLALGASIQQNAVAAQLPTFAVEE